MSAFDVQDQICYVQCGFCNTTLLVNVPWGSLTKVVTVRCGHCTTIFPVDMLPTKTCAAVPFHLISSSHQEIPQKRELLQSEEETPDKKLSADSSCFSLYFSSDDEEEEDTEESSLFNQAAHEPPKKKQRAPSVYNQFIKEEIKRLKIEYPNMTHKQAFGAAAKNWAYSPQSQYKYGEVPGSSEENLKKMLPIQHYCDADQEVRCFGNGFQGTMTLRQPIFSKFPFY